MPTVLTMAEKVTHEMANAATMQVMVGSVGHTVDEKREVHYY